MVCKRGAPVCNPQEEIWVQTPPSLQIQVRGEAVHHLDPAEVTLRGCVSLAGQYPACIARIRYEGRHACCLSCSSCYLLPYREQQEKDLVSKISASFPPNSIFHLLRIDEGDCSHLSAFFPPCPLYLRGLVAEISRRYSRSIVKGLHRRLVQGCYHMPQRKEASE